jgi:hypothetical protein|tara:strand:- start:66084 stop:66629 length:546 start_codon:yes stop_codon:yes gene_type:complete
MATKKAKPSCDDIEFDSEEELEFYHWVKEALEFGFISKYDYNNISYDLAPKQSYQVTKQLKTKTKVVDKHLFHAHIYTPDFILYPDTRWKLLKDEHKLLELNDKPIVIDVKGTFQMHDGSRSFSMNQKWMYDKHGIYVNKLIPCKFFALTWLPEACKYTKKTKKLRAKYKDIPTLREKFAL